jgi:hypothetical protein
MFVGSGFQIEVKLPIDIDGKAPAVAPIGVGFLSSLLIQVATLASSAFGVGEDAGVGIAGFDGRPGVGDGLGLSADGVVLSGAAGFARFDQIAGLERRACRRRRYG